MTREDIIRMAREAGLLAEDESWVSPHQEAMERFAALVAAAKEAEINDGLTIAYMDGYEKGKEAGAAAEREACAAICDRFQARDVGMQPAECAGAIRARGQT